MFKVFLESGPWGVFRIKVKFIFIFFNKEKKGEENKAEYATPSKPKYYFCETFHLVLHTRVHTHTYLPFAGHMYMYIVVCDINVTSYHGFQH